MSETSPTPKYRPMTFGVTRVVLRDAVGGASDVESPVSAPSRRDGDEVTSLAGVRIAPATVQAENRAFDVTPAALVTGYISEDGVERH